MICDRTGPQSREGVVVMTWRLISTLVLFVSAPVWAQGWLSVQTVTIQPEAPPPGLLEGDTPPEMVHVQIAATDASGADEISVRSDATALVCGANEPPLPARYAWLDLQKPEQGPAQLTIDLWFDLPLAVETLESAMVRLVLDHWELAAQDFTLQPGEGGWQFPLTVQTPWMEASITGVGVGQITAGVRAIRDWLGTGGAGPPDVQSTAAIMGDATVMAFAEVDMLKGSAAPEELSLILNVGDTKIVPAKVQTNSRSQQVADDLDLQRRVAACTFIYPEGTDPAQLQRISAITLRVTRRIPLAEHWLAPIAPEPSAEEAPAEQAPTEQQPAEGGG